MLPRPLHRWKSFWLGVFVVVFLGLAWVRSMGSHSDLFAWASGDGAFEVQLYQHEGEIGLWYGSNYVIHDRGFRMESEVIDLSGPWFPRFFEIERRPNGPSIGIAHWFLILLFLLPRTTWLVWRSRRMKRLASEPGSAGLQTGSNRP